VYFATFDGGYDGGIMITASHKPPDYNGMKFVREQSKPISGDNGLQAIRAFVNAAISPRRRRAGVRHHIDTTDPYVAQLLTYVDARTLKPLKIWSMPQWRGGSDHRRLEPHLPFQFIKVHEPDGHSQRYPESHDERMRAHGRGPIRRHGADLRHRWDG